MTTPVFCNTISFRINVGFNFCLTSHCRNEGLEKNAKTISLNFNGESNGRGNGTKMEARAMKGIYWVCIGNARETEKFCRIGSVHGLLLGFGSFIPR